MKQKSVCGNCHGAFFSPVTKVYVFKRHFCPDDKEEVLNFDGSNTFSCPKCKKIFRKDNLVEYGSMGTGIMGTARHWEEVQKRMSDGKTDYESIMVPTEQYCQRCKNLTMRRMQLEHTRELKEKAGMEQIQKIPKEITNADIYCYEIQKKTQEDWKTEQQKLQQEQQIKTQEEARKKAEATAKAKLVEGMTKELTKKNLVE